MSGLPKLCTLTIRDLVCQDTFGLVTLAQSPSVTTLDLGDEVVHGM